MLFKVFITNITTNHGGVKEKNKVLPLSTEVGGGGEVRGWAVGMNGGWEDGVRGGRTFALRE